MGKVIYHGIRIKFRIPGSPHSYCFLWVQNAFSLTADSKEDYIFFVDKIVHAYTPERHKHPQLYDLVKLYQLHRKYKTCRKYKNQVCRFNIGKCFISRTIFAEPLPENMSENGKILLLQKQVIQNSKIT